MDELRVLRDLGDETPLPDDASIGAARAAFLAGVAERGRSERLPRARGARRALVGTSVIGLAAAVAAAIALLPADRPPTGGQAAAYAVTDPVRLLNHAARAARAEPADPPRPDQFVYQRVTSEGGVAEELWTSVDGTRDGLITDTTGREIPIPGCRDGRRAVLDGPAVVPGVTAPCEPHPAYRSDLPTDVDGMLALLDASPERSPIRLLPGAAVHDLGTSVPPLARAALYEALARTPGLTVVPDARDAADRPAVGLDWLDPLPSTGEPRLILFDPVTYELLGVTGTAITRTGFVDQVGQRP